MSQIVFGSANHWTSPYQVGSHAWARMFAGSGWRTAYVSDPVTPWHWLNRANRNSTRERFSLWWSGGAFYEEQKLRAWVPCSLIAPQNRPVFRGRWVLLSWDLLSFPPVVSRLNEWGFDTPDVLWLDSVRHLEWGKRLLPKLTVLRLADWIGGFSSTPTAILEMEKRLFAEADLVIASAETLEEKVRPLRRGRAMVTIRNGVDMAFWQTPRPAPPEYREIPAPRVIYVGAVDDWFDRGLLEAVARALPRVSFVIVGRKPLDGTAGAVPANVHWLGTRPREEACGFMQHAQVGIIPFKRSELIDHVCPLKLYEYMACGLPVVATRWNELERMNSPARLATGLEEWVVHLKAATTDAAGSSAKQQATAYASAHDWQRRWDLWWTTYQKLANDCCT